MKNSILIAVFGVILFLPTVTAAHYIVGIVNDARDGTMANDHTILLWSEDAGINDNLTDIIGPNGSSGSNNTYMIDCELLNNSCRPGKYVRVMVINNGDNYITTNVSVKVTGSGYNEAPNLTLNSPPNITNAIVDDALSIPANEIDLVAASNRDVTCEAIAEDLDGDSFQNATAQFYNSSSFYGDGDDNNNHYSNNSCFINSSYGTANQSQIICNFQVRYYADPGQWECTVIVEDNLSISGNSSDTTTMNTLLSVGLIDIADFGVVNMGQVSSELTLNVTNYGNVKVNLSLEGYAVNVGDGLAMNCTSGIVQNITVEHAKYNLTGSTSGSLTLGQTSNYYLNLTTNPVTKIFNLGSRQNDTFNEAYNNTYWRMYVPTGVEGNCSGNIVFGARQETGT
jgi:hypothetical protein